MGEKPEQYLGLAALRTGRHAHLLYYQGGGFLLVAIVKGQATLFRMPEHEPVGWGSCVLHVKEGAPGHPPEVQGTLSIRGWQTNPTHLIWEGTPHRLEFQDRRWLDILIKKFTPTDCGSQILRFTGISPIQEGSQVRGQAAGAAGS